MTDKKDRPRPSFLTEGAGFADAIPSAEAPHQDALWQSLDDALATLEAADDGNSDHTSSLH